MTTRDRLIVALDSLTLPSAVALARRLHGVVGTLKVGSILFTACGPVAIRRIRTLGFRIMLDLKFHDIPSTVEQSCRVAVHHGVSMLTVHTIGGAEMLRAAVRGVAEEARQRQASRPLVLGITVLTSLGGPSPAAVSRQVARLAAMAQAAGCDGVVASARETGMLRRTFGQALRIICPGIRPIQRGRTTRDDQQRTATPAEAMACGADALVMGRPITGSADPKGAAQQILHEMEAHQAC